MRCGWAVLGLGMVLAAGARGQITRTATFENYAAGMTFQISFKDSPSGIIFSNSTHPPAGSFAIDDDILDLFTGTNYLTAGGIPDDDFGSYLGFTANLPEPSNQVSINVYYSDVAGGPGITLEGFNSSGMLVAEQSALNPGTYTLQIDSNQYIITSFQVIANGGFEGYDNISYTYLPEPAELGWFVIAAGIGLGRRKCPHR